MSRTLWTVLMYGRTSAYFLPQAAAKDLARLRLAFSIAGVLGTLAGRTGLNWPGLQSRAGLLSPTPRGSKPMTSYWAATALGSEDATKPASVRPLPPGPPGLTSSGPWYFVAVCGTRDRARVIFRPCGLAWSSGTFTDAHWRVGESSVPHFFQVTFVAWTAFADCAVLAPAGTAVSVPASTTVAPHSTAALFLMKFLQKVGG